MGGHGGLNILPQKRWNVYNRDNRERVRRDEQEAARQEQEQKQQNRAEQGKLRLSELRRNRGHGGPCEDRDLKRAEKQKEPIKLRRNSKRKREEDEDQNEGKDEQQPEELTSINQHNLEDLFKAEELFNLVPGPQDDPGRKDVEKLKQKRPEKKPKEEQAADDERYRLAYGNNGKKRPWYMSTSNSLLKPEPEETTRHSVEKPRKPEQKHGRKSLEELRQERMQREGREKSKAQRLLNSSSSSSASKKYNSAYGTGSR